MATRKEKIIERFSTRRLEALSDGVFAIAMTLLVLNLDISEVGDVTNNQQLWHALRHMSDQLISFFVSFLLLGGLWIIHTRQFELIKETNSRLMTVNNLRLLAVVTIPFTTSLASDYGDIPFAQIIFSFNFFLIIALSYWEWNYATGKKSGLDNSLTKKEIQFANFRNKTMLLIAGTVVILSAFIGQLAFLLFLVMAILRHFSLSKRLNDSL